MQKPNSKKIPEVRYHPTIQNPTKKNQTKTRSSQPQRARPPRVCPPQAKGMVVQEDPPVSPEPSAQKPSKKAAQKANTGPPQKAAPPPGRAPPPGKAPPPDRAPPPDKAQPTARALSPGIAPPPDRAPPPGRLPPTCKAPPPGKALPPPEQVPLGLDVSLDRCVVKQVEELTRGQSTNEDWFSWRKNRITASMVHNIAHCKFVNGKSKTPPKSYLSAVTGEGSRVTTRAMSWGIKMESEAVCRYQELKSAALGRPVDVQDCGLFIDPRRSWLAASPDRMVTDSRTGKRLCLEVKCPYKHRDRLVEDACRDDPAFCLEIQEEDGQSPSYRLKTSHSYYSQIQCQLAVTGLQEADFVVFTQKETAIVPVTFDAVLWEDTVSKLEIFYRDAVLPHLRGKKHAAAAIPPEL